MANHIRILDFLRGIAALMVVFLHFGNGGLPTVSNTVVSGFCAYGLYGVHVFFVISGFIIPYALYRSGYQIRYFFRHLMRRFVRIDPPAYISLLFLFALYYGAIFIKGSPINGMAWPGTGTAAVIGNLTYTIDYLDADWYSGVFWTLAIEFQFYLIIGLLLPLFVSGDNKTVALLVISVLVLYHLPFYSFFRYGSFFMCGLLLFLMRERLVTIGWGRSLLLLSLVFCFFQRGVTECFFGAGTCMVIAFFSFSTRITDHLGKISFSLYLTHLFVGWTAEIVMGRLGLVPQTEMAKIITLLLFVCVAVVFATVFYHLVEKRWQALSRRLTVHKKESATFIEEIQTDQANSIHTGA